MVVGGVVSGVEWSRGALGWSMEAWGMGKEGGRESEIASAAGGLREEGQIAALSIVRAFPPC